MAEYSVGSLGNFISGSSQQGQASKIVYKAVTQQAREAFSTNKENSKKVKEKFGALSRNRKPEIAGDEKSHVVGKSWTCLPSRDGNSDFNSSAISQVGPSFTRNAARRVSIRKNTHKHLDHPEREARTVFVGNIPLDHAKKIKKVFADYGEIESVRLRCAPLKDPRMAKKVAVIKQEFHPERSSINAYIVYKTEREAKNALQANRMMFHDHHLRVDMASSDGQHDFDPRKSVFIGNLAFGAEEEDLWSMFSSCGAITSVRIVRDSLTAVSKGIAFINFENADSVELALQMDGEALRKRNMVVKRHKPTGPSTQKQNPQGNTPRHKGASAQDSVQKGKEEMKEKRRMEKKEKRKKRREEEKRAGIVKKKIIPPDGVEKSATAQITPVECSPKTTAEEKDKGRKSVRFEGQRVDKNQKKKKKVNKGILKKKKVAHLLKVSGQKK